MHEYVLDIAVIAVKSRSNVVSKEKFGKPARLGMPKAREEMPRKQRNKESSVWFARRGVSKNHQLERFIGGGLGGCNVTGG